MAINVLEWITCPHCATNFRISVPNSIIGIFAEGEEEDEYYTQNYRGYNRLNTHCPKCSEEVYAYLIFE